MIDLPWKQVKPLWFQSAPHLLLRLIRLLLPVFSEKVDYRWMFGPEKEMCYMDLPMVNLMELAFTIMFSLTSDSSFYFQLNKGIV